MIINKEDLSCRDLRQLSVYIHIPFCVKKCDYCDFLSAPATEAEIETYSGALIREVADQAKYYKEYIVTTVFLGGGTPSLLSKQQIREIIKTLEANYNCAEKTEVSIEINPGTVTEAKLETYLQLGINRISIGLQSANDEELISLGRIHNYAQFLKTYQLARNVGFENINIDIMAALPGQTMSSYTDTLEKVIALDPEHISAYSLIVEEETPFYERYRDGKGLPCEETDREMYEATKRFLGEKGYHRYEISNYAKSGYECRHNLVYWQRGNYVGFGAGAASMVENIRWKNPSHREYYTTCPAKVELQKLTQKEQMEEFMFLGLRVMNGISMPQFQALFSVNIKAIYGDVIERLENEKLLREKNGQIYLSEKGIDLSNYVFEKFLF